MIEQIVNVLTHEEEKWKEVLFLLLKVLITAILSNSLFIYLFGSYELLSLFNYQEIYDFIVSGMIVKVIFIFCLTWFFSYGFSKLILFLLTRKLVNKTGEALDKVYSDFDSIKNDYPNFKEEPFVKFLRKTLRNLDIIEETSGKSKPGSLFYSFYESLAKAEKGDDFINSSYISDRFGVFIQLWILNFLLDLNLIDYNGWVLVIAIIAFIIILILAWFSYLLLSVLGSKHYKILNVMDKIDSSLIEDVKKEEAISQDRSRNE